MSAAEKKCGFANGFMSAGGEIGSDKLRTFIENYPDADLYYIVMGFRATSQVSQKEAQRVALATELVNAVKKIMELDK